MLKKGTLASPAIALASSVFPVPGGPISNTPFGILAPTAVKRSGFFKNVTTSSNSSLASSTPATSLNTTPVLASIWNSALDLLNDIACPGPPVALFDFRNKNAKPPTSKRGNSRFPAKFQIALVFFAGCASKSTCAFLSLVISSGAFAGSSTLIFCTLFPNSGPTASTIAVCPLSYMSTFFIQFISKYSRNLPYVIRERARLPLNCSLVGTKNPCHKKKLMTIAGKDKSNKVFQDNFIIIEPFKCVLFFL
uniref:Uncharacterized protein n=1 Tax=Melanthalia intermedia TaxID=172989 RepID=A0A345UAY4_9FLOR|nr:hypothetical protein [Melanthalia intermedia]AXI97620.1 hypothetical protein [Melanthalia intermedia]